MMSSRRVTPFPHEPDRQPTDPRAELARAMRDVERATHLLRARRERLERALADHEDRREN